MASLSRRGRQHSDLTAGGHTQKASRGLAWTPVMLSVPIDLHPPGRGGGGIVRSSSCCNTSARPGKAPPCGCGCGVSCHRQARLLGSTGSGIREPHDLLLRLSLVTSMGTAAAGSGLGTGAGCEEEMMSSRALLITRASCKERCSRMPPR
ncbi:hypothetical protein GDO81_022952 [Engystomops pustulosus]|uniref:Arginine vasotocin receptor n=1 Tax=Engystomops pustulosus TaxID=76066 RepID=A0AAV6ZMY5_ENGPU|nr:hypothetical protein GDO81_022952 [Engystomops pustulosus]